MWCKACNKRIHSNVCADCKGVGQVDTPTEVQWCSECKVPIVKEVDDISKGNCPLCDGKTQYLSSDVRPVFPEERLLIELLIGKPFVWKNCSVWASDNRYYIDGVVKTLSKNKFTDANIEKIISDLDKNKANNDYATFNKYLAKFIEANKQRLNYIKDEAAKFIEEQSAKYKTEQLVISFSGGKDSTVVADLVVRALSNPSIVHIYGDTTLEFPQTYEYVQRYRKANPQAIFKVAKNKEQEFYSVCEDIGPPARMLRWCCTMFKTGPITRVLNSLYREEKVLTFYGIRKSESLSRSKYNRVADDATQIKIKKQTVASPIFCWSDLEIWLYLLGEKVDFNDAYRLGYDRVGCWCCPNNNSRAQFLAKIYMSEQAKKWRDYLIGFAQKIGKPDPEEYIDGGWWKARQGGNGMVSADDIQIKFTNCTTEDNAKIYKLNKIINESFYNLFVPFGKVSKELGRKIIGEVLVLDNRTNVPIIAIQTFSQQGYDYAIKIKTLNIKSHANLQRMISYQIKKFNACRKCLKCESICSSGAISVFGDSYKIDERKCTRCKACVTAKFLDGGCLMDKFLKTRADNKNGDTDEN